MSATRNILKDRLPLALRPWYSIIWPFLALASLPYELAIRIHSALFYLGVRRPTRLPIPVISVGNITTGGTGKTPCVEWVARHLRNLGFRVAILSRGYSAIDGKPNDEYLVLEENLPDVPHLQDADRIGMGRKAIEELETEVIVLDDGMQHRKLARDLELVLVDATDPYGGGWCLPAGLLREPVTALGRAQAILITRSDLIHPDDLELLRDRLARFAPRAVIAQSIHAPTGWLDADHPGDLLELVDRPSNRAAIFSGIGNPAAFRATVEKIGIEVVDERIFPDHHAYASEDVAELSSWAATLPEGVWLATTQKDLVKLRVDQLAGRPLRGLRIGLKLGAGGERLASLLDRLGMDGIDPIWVEPIPDPSPDLALESV